MHHWVVLAARWYCAAAALMRGHRADLWRYAQAMRRAVVLVVLLVLMVAMQAVAACHLRAVLLADRLAMRRFRVARQQAAVQATCRLRSGWRLSLQVAQRLLSLVAIRCRRMLVAFT
jgi:hypothetical protein